MHKYVVSRLTALFSFNSLKSSNIHSNEKNKISKSKLGSLLSNTKNFRNQIKGFCSTGDQTQDLFWGHPVYWPRELESFSSMYETF